GQACYNRHERSSKTRSPALPWIGDYQALAASSHAIHAVWTDTRTGQMRLFAASARTRADQGHAPRYPHRVDDAAAASSSPASRDLGKRRQWVSAWRNGGSSAATRRARGVGRSRDPSFAEGSYGSRQHHRLG